LLASTPAAGWNYAALSPARPGAMRFERMILELWGHHAEGAVDLRPWLDHGRWNLRHPLAAKPIPFAGEAPQPEFLPTVGDGIHQIPVGPIHAGVIESGHFRFSVQGEAIVRLEQRLGYKHKGTLSLMLGTSPRAAVRYAARLSGDSTVAHSWAFSAAVEAALGVTPPPRALHLRALMLELERVHNHLNDWGFVCNDVAFAYPHARCGLLREGVLRAIAAAFGHRLMMDRVLPGGVAPDIAPRGTEAILAALAAVEAEIPVLMQIYEAHASLQDRVPLPPAGMWAAHLAAPSMRVVCRSICPMQIYISMCQCWKPVMWMRGCGFAYSNSANPSPWSGKSWPACRQAN